MSEHEPKLPPPQSIEPDSTYHLTDGVYNLEVRKEKTTLVLKVSREEKVVFQATLTPDRKVHLVFDGNVESETPSPQLSLVPEPAVEVQEQEHPPITLEGVPVRGAKYDREKSTYKLILAHHPDPKDRKVAVCYEIVAQGQKAEELYKAYVTDSRVPVRITGSDHSYTLTRKDKPAKTVRLIQAESIEKIRERWDSPEILSVKVRLAEL